MFHAAVMVHKSTSLCVSTGPHRPSTRASASTISSWQGWRGRGRVLWTTVRPPQHQQEATLSGRSEPRAASRQLSHLPLCVTGSWKKSCGSCSLADKRLQKSGGAKNHKRGDGRQSTFSLIQEEKQQIRMFQIWRSNCSSVISWSRLNPFIIF